MNFSRLVSAAGGILIAISAACGGDSGGPGGGGQDTTGTGGTTGTMTAKIDGVAFTADKKVTVDQDPGGVYTLVGTTTGAPAVIITLGLFNIADTGTYPIGVGATVIGATGISSTAAQQWATPMDH